MRRILFVRLAAVVATLACCLSHFPLGVHTLPVGLANPRRVGTGLSGRELPLYNTNKKNRYSRETSESILTMATTPQLPLTESAETTESSEGSGAAETQGIRCANRIQRTSQCKTLKEKLVEYFDKFYELPPLDSFYSSFVLEDINFFGLLGGDSSFEPDSERTRRKGNNNCAAILEHYHRPQVVSAGICTWNYTCSYDPNRFPRFLLQATLLNPQLYNTQRCDEVVMNRVTYFQREECQEDPCRRENWVESVMDTIVVGFEEHRNNT